MDRFQSLKEIYLRSPTSVFSLFQIPARFFNAIRLTIDDDLIEGE
jgi:hypothetical protein